MSYKVLARIATITTLLVLAACQTPNTGSNDGGKWKNIGASANQNVTHEIDTASIKRNGDVVGYRTRMVLKNAGLESTPNLPAFKTGINQYQMYCKNKTYRITDTELRNATGAVVYQQTFGSQVPLQRITAGSPAQKQYDSVCT
ncbi:MAG TPA: hypothetical protein PK856_04255 [Vitreoscilla sp.]|jgi:hypothetical protein|nr:hypothetical protein [Vitreoscilla sp.]